MDEKQRAFVELLNLQIGCLLKVNRLRRDISQHDLSLIIESNPTAIGRIERAEGIGGWDKIYILSTELNINFNELFTLLPQSTLLSIVHEIYEKDTKLTTAKKEYYRSLKSKIKKYYSKLED